MNVKKDIRFRVYIAFTGICLFGAAILIKAATIQVKEGPELRSLSKEMHTRTVPLPAERGNIYTEDGVLLSSSVPQFDIHVDFSVIDKKLFDENVDSLAMCLSHLMGDETILGYKRQLQTAYANQERYYSLFRNLPYNKYEELRTFPIFRLGQNRGGFIVGTDVKRDNPFSDLGSRTIGWWRNNKALFGLESTYDSVLRGISGSRIEQKSTGGVWIPVDGSDVEPVNGKDLVTTLDIQIQDIAEQSLLSVLERQKCIYGTCIVMEVNTGKIRALVNLGRQPDGSYEEDRNYALLPTEPGSTFKVVTLLSILGDKYATVNDIIDAEGGVKRFANATLHDADKGLHQIPIWKAYAESSNVSFAKLAFMYYNKQPEKFWEHMHHLQLDKKTGIDVTGEYPPRVKPVKYWSAISLPWMATGYEVQVSPMRTCMLYNAVANGGNMMKPYLVSAVREYGKDIKEIKPTVIEKVGDSSTIAQIKRCVEAVVEQGTAHAIESPFYQIAGKTGTARVADRGISYRDGYYQGSFVGFFPAQKPRYTICVVIRTPPHSSAFYGASIAGPVFRMISDKLYASNIGTWSGTLDSIAKEGGHNIEGGDATEKNYEVLLNAVGIKTHMPDVKAGTLTRIITDSAKRIEVQPQPLAAGLVPDVTGMGLKEAVYVLEREGMQVRLQGTGRVHSQSIAPGTKINKGQTIILQLS